MAHVLPPCCSDAAASLSQGAGTFVAVFDLLSGTRVGRMDLRSKILELAFAPNSPMVVAVAQVGIG